MSEANGLLRRALEALGEGIRPIRKVELIDEIRTYLDAQHLEAVKFDLAKRISDECNPEDMEYEDD